MVVNVASCQHVNGLWNGCPGPIMDQSDGVPLRSMT